MCRRGLIVLGTSADGSVTTNGPAYPLSYPLMSLFPSAHSGHAASGDDEVRAPMPTVRDTLIGGPSGLRGPVAPVPPGGLAPQLPTPDSLTWGSAMLAQNLATMLNPSAVASGAASIFGRPGACPIH